MRRTATSPNVERTGFLFAAGAAILYGAAYPATALGLRSFTPLAIGGLACTLALVVMLALAFSGVLPRPSRAALNRPSLVRLFVLTGLGGIGFIAAVNIAVMLSGSTVTGFVAPLYAVFGALLAVPILGERVRPVALASFVVALVGTALLADVGPASGSAFIGVVLAMGSAAMFGGYIVLSRRWSTSYGLDGMLITIANLVSRGPLLLIVELIRTGGAPLVPDHPDPVAIVALLTIGLGSSSTANLLLIASVRRVPAGRTSAALLLTPISSAIISVALLSERLEPIQAIGGALILLGIAGASGLVERWLGRTSSGGATAGPGDRPPVGPG